jgi:hypothetical protein
MRRGKNAISSGGVYQAPSRGRSGVRPWCVVIAGRVAKTTRGRQVSHLPPLVVLLRDCSGLVPDDQPEVHQAQPASTVKLSPG